MYEQPINFPAISNRESWVQTVQFCDDETGDLITLTDGGGNPLYSIYLEISSGYRGGRGGSPYGASYYDDCGGVIVQATLDNYISIIGIGTVQIQIPYTIMQGLNGNKTYSVFMRIEDAANQDARQVLIGSLPVAYGGRGQ